MSSTSDASLISALNNASTQLNRYFGIFIFVFGVAGNTLNTGVLSRRTLRSNPCAWLFLASSIANNIAILAGITSRPLSTWSADLTNTNQFLCKFRAFLLFNGITIGSWLIMLATVDRWLSSNINASQRQKSTLKNAQLGTILVVIVSSIIEAQQLYCFEANLTNTPLKCYTRSVWCGIVSDLFFALVSILAPLILMIIFGLMTIANIHKSNFRLQPAISSFIAQMSSISDASLIALLNNASTQINRYVGIFIFIFGIVGNTLNTCVLSQRPLRSNPCAWLFLVSSIVNGIAILAALTSRPLSTWSADLTNTNQFLCKFRAFLLFNGITISSWLIMLATVDRWFSSNINASQRQRSTLKNAQLGTILIVFVSTIIEAQHLYCFEANLTNTPLKCYTKSVWCAFLSDLSLVLITFLIPLLLMIIFGLMTISNIRKSRLRLQPANKMINDHAGHNTAATEQKKTDRHLLIMLLVQVSLIFLFTFPLAIDKLYATITQSMPKSPLRKAIENLIFNVLLLLSNVSSGMPFYVYTLSGGSVFRKALFDFLRILSRKMMCRRG
ncbi:unnamed protein product [Rotaria sp. Silwood1]|nr:unnamed protein product [Rotaria sp. Silwood1]CAF1313521.1 unnamed protein product [Rotaria sp. Silwood1]CAF3491917.1 unnamed protein product [Rotaria sp. Silwood1]CAF3544521.1 unnamed protein product [Rotaria sp. Silwood1]CAF4590992.1 unnamed protein product [Rotaria sp. Silwood1]